MKKLALLLGALSLVSSVAYAKEVVPAVEEVVVVEEAAPVAAAPALRVTNVGQFIEIDNASGHNTSKGMADIGEDVFFGTNVGLAYGDDWTFGLMASKIWNVDTDGVHSKNHRLELDAWRNFENFSVGARWRQESEKDRYLARFKYNYGMFSGWVDAGYESQNDGAAGYTWDDNWYSEGMPVAVTVGPVTVGYYYEYLNYVGADNASENAVETDLRHQVRAMFPIYSGEKLTLSGEYRYQFAQDVEQYDKFYEYKVEENWQEKTAHVAILNASYAVTDALTVSGYYRYDFNEYEAHGHGVQDKADDYYGEFSIGWNYAF